MSGQSLTAREEAQRAQLLASDPRLSAWVSASAGSGKTKVLTDRVLRLLLQDGQAANRILCLTFTKAAAAEMQTRLARRLGEWPCLEERRLCEQLLALGVEPGEAELRRARRLFAEVLELPGGMRISTIHAFCQSLLRAFPLEAALPPQFSVIEEAESAALLADAREAVLAGGLAPPGELARVAGLVSAEDFSAAVTALLRARDRLTTCLQASNGTEGLRLRLARALGLDGAAVDEAGVIAAACALEEAPLRLAASLLAASRNANDQARAAKLAEWLGLRPEQRAPRFAEWCEVFLTREGEIRKTLATKQVGARLAEVVEALQREGERLRATHGQLSAARLLAATEALLALSRPVLDQYEARKQRAGLLAYDDLIATARRILQDPGSAWVLFKLDGGLDHVLLDEAQDTNPAQWGITRALTEEFFAGQGVERRDAAERCRTIFAVGDIKQSIYSFQGADPVGFSDGESFFRRRVEGLGQRFETVRLDVSFRSTAPVLGLVDAVFADGPACAGVVDGAGRLHHRPDRASHAGCVELWPLLRKAETPKAEAWLVPEVPERVAGPDALLAEALAARLARMIRHETLPARCLDPASGQPRRVQPSDILVLVRRRTRFVQLLVRALKERGVPVGGVDRLQLIEQIAVQDLLALCDVLLLPDDDLQLAVVLKSPLVGIGEEELFGLAWQRPGSLWGALLQHRGQDSPLGQAADWLARLADRADLVTPHALLAEVLGEHRGRAKLLARLGPDAGDPLDEVLNAALDYEASHPPSLQGFLHWLRRGNAEIKREAESGADAVRIMTVHGAKGLQAPVVVLPDLGSGKGEQLLRWMALEEGVELPLWAPKNRKEFRAPAYAALLAEAERKRAEEENRLLYVALTRAEDRLLVCGWGEPDPASWHGLVQAGFRRLPGAAECAFDPSAFGAPAACDFGGEPLWRLESDHLGERVADRALAAAEAAPLPAWALRPAPPEAAEAAIQPSALPGEQETPAAAPHGTADPLGRRFRRGRLLHALLQHLPERDPAEREAAARRFLARPGHGLAPEEQAEALREVLALLAAPAMAAAFAPGSLAEAPIAGTVGGRLVAGQVDRLVVERERVLVLDYKTNRPPPATAGEVAPLYLRQMAAYRAVLRQAFPGRRVECALVWTYGARLMPLPDALLDRHAPAPG